MIDNSFLLKLIKKPEKISKLKFETISSILIEVKNIFEKENLLLEFDVGATEEVYVIGDIHGNLESLLKLYEIITKKNPKLVIFLGDIVDRGPRQLECLIFVLSLKILKPQKYFILKGNHETLEMNQAYGFFYEFVQKFENYDNFNEILEIYNVLPICVIINNSILCLHGGIPEDINILKKLKDLKHKDINNSVLKSIAPGIFQIMWNDPKSGLSDFINNYRGPGINYFGKDAFDKFMKENNLKYLIRAHECFPEGYVWFFNYRLLSIFSSANYRGGFSPNPASYAIIKNNSIIPRNLEI
jgi:serine/threonine-protein phosphatase PP1 catalytic subunit